MQRTTGRSLRGAVRQWRFPRALRIAAAKPPAGLDELVDEMRRLGQPARRNGSGPVESVESVESVLDDRALADLATGLWRARRRMLEPGGDEPRPEVRKEFRHVRSTWDTLADAGVKVQDHDGTRYDTGLALEVLTFQPTAGLEHEVVLDTIRPSVYVQGRTIQLGQVIVGDAFQMMAEDLARMKGQADAFGPTRLSRVADLVIATLDDMTGATSPRLQLELMVARVLARATVPNGADPGTLPVLEATP